MLNSTKQGFHNRDGSVGEAWYNEVLHGTFGDGQLLCWERSCYFDSNPAGLEFLADASDQTESKYWDEWKHRAQASPRDRHE
jgi:hypothetical protein